MVLQIIAYNINVFFFKLSGGYIGLFIGYTLSQAPDLAYLLINWACKLTKYLVREILNLQELR